MEIDELESRKAIEEIKETKIGLRKTAKLTSLDGYVFELTPGDSEGQGSLESCSPWGRKELDMTELLKSNNVPSSEISVLRAKSLQLHPTLCNSMDCLSARLSVHGIL